MPRSRELMDKVLTTFVAYKEAMLSFDKITAEVGSGSSGLQHPDGVQALQNADRVRRMAFETHSKAIKEYTDYLLEVEQRQRHPGSEPPTQT
jgi:hypothetical protein